LTERFLARPLRDGLNFLTIAEISARDFSQARLLPGFAGWDNFHDFCLERDFLRASYAMAGVAAPRQSVSFAAFEGWSRLTGAPLDVDGLDEFAAHWRYRARNPLSPARGLFGAPGQPERQPVEIDGAQVVLVRRDIYARWERDFAARAPFPAPDLDVYATRVVACCLPASARARRSAANILWKSASKLDERS
jgi:hypothetical protein